MKSEKEREYNRKWYLENSKRAKFISANRKKYGRDWRKVIDDPWQKVRTCFQCKKEQDISQFGKVTDKVELYHTRCNKCRSENAIIAKEKRKLSSAADRAKFPERNAKTKKEYKIKNAEKIRQQTKIYNFKNRNAIIARRYNTTKKHIDTLINDANGKCNICGCSFGKFGPCIDHCHISGEIRGVLCVRCNNGIGLMDSDPDILENAIKYLYKSHASALVA